jgi:flagellar biogenesis protein FliO
MVRLLSCVALGLTVISGQASLGTEPAAMHGPPAWQDGGSVYSVNTGSSVGDDTQPAQTSQNVDPYVVHAAHRAESTSAGSGDPRTTAGDPRTTAGDQRRLAPPTDSARSPNITFTDEGQPARGVAQRKIDLGFPMDSIYTMASALAIVVGAFLLCAWLLRRGTGRAAGRRGELPAEVVSVLGRVPLAARQFAQLLRVGNKLVLISLSPAGAETLTEVTDPAEVDRLAGLCQQSDPHSTTKAFDQVFRQLAREPASNGFLGDEMHLPTLSPPPEFDSLLTPRVEAARA